MEIQKVIELLWIFKILFFILETHYMINKK